MTQSPPTSASFSELQLPDYLLDSLKAVGYESPTPIQAQAIPILMKGQDLLGHAPTGTGKTAAFTLPLLSRIEVNRKAVQLLVLAPTRELAIQVSEAFQRYASKMPGFHVLPIYGGQEYGHQLRQLKRGVHVVVGTPGRVMDHMRRGSLKLEGLKALVLDEADEMLRMGFVDDVEWILQQAPDDRQMALFSATMPKQVEQIARRHLKDPQSVAIKAKTATADTINQRYWVVSGMYKKLEALTRVLEFEPFDATLIFVRTKLATVELAERLEARGYAAAAINGDMAQKNREQVIDKLKRGTLDVLVATDVAARGLDVERITHVVNFDIPYDAEAYIHRIGRTGRAGRQGEAILFVAPRERRMLTTIERATRQPIARLELPTTEMVNNKRLADYKQRITDTLAAGELDFLRSLMDQYQSEHNVPALDIAAAVAKLALGNQPLLLKPDTKAPEKFQESDGKSGYGKPVRKRRGDAASKKDSGKGPKQHKGREDRPKKGMGKPEKGMDRYRIDVGHDHEVKPGNIVGAIASEAGLDGRYIGRIDIQKDHSLIDLPSGMPGEVYGQLKKTRVCGQRLNLTRVFPEASKKPKRKK